MRSLPRNGGSEGGFTLAELLVAVAILTFLSLMLVTTTASTLRTWKAGEGTRQAYARARIAFEEIGRDLELLHPTGRSEGAIRYGLYGGKQPNGRVFILFVASFSERDETLITYRAGEQPVSDGYQDYYMGREVPGVRLRAQDGLVEILYVYDPGLQEIKRIRRSPLGGSGSLFDPNTLTPEFIQNNGSVIASNVLYFNVLYGGPESTTWVEGQSVRTGGPLTNWDSSCARSSTFPYRGDPVASRLADGFYPAKIRVTLVAQSPELSIRTETLTDMDDRASRVSALSLKGFPNPSGGKVRYARLGTEWIGYRSQGDGALLGVRRGQRGTTAQAHPAGTPIWVGREFTLVRSLSVSLPLRSESR